MKALIRLTPDVTTKAHETRKRFTRRVADNVRAALHAAGLNASVRRTLARLYMEYDDPIALAVARRTFGVHSVSPCRETPVESLDDVVRTGRELMAERVRGRRFAVRANVRDRKLGFRSTDVNEELGETLCAYGRVDLDTPDITVRCEIRDGTAWFFETSLPGEGGLPVGAAGRAIVLLSGGFDSAVAAYLLMSRGIVPDFVAMRMGGDTHARQLAAVANLLASRWAPGAGARLIMVPFEETVERLRAEVPPRLWQLVLKRLMYRTAEAAASRCRADAVATGESVGQVSSQTLPNLRALDTRMTLPVFRPLLTYDKPSIISLARHVGTHDVSARVQEYCALAADKPATSVNVGALHRAEDGMPFDAEALLDTATWHTLPTRAAAGDEDVEVERVPEGAVLLDLRSPPVRRQQAIPGAEAVDPLEIIEHPESLDANVPYAVVCDVGARSTWFARRLRELGLQAWSLAPDHVQPA